MIPQISAAETGQSSGPSALSISIESATPMDPNLRLVASSGSTHVSLRPPSKAVAQEIRNHWDALVSLNQEITCTKGSEMVRIFRDVACAYGAQVIEDVDGRPGPIESTVTHLEIHPPDSCQDQCQPTTPFTWTTIERPTKGSLEWAATRSGLELSALEQYLNDPDPCAVLRSSTCLVTRTYELTLPQMEKSFGALSAKLCTMICGDDFLITICHQPTSGVQHVWNDIQSKRIHPQEYCSSNAVARLIVESTLAKYQQTVEELSRTIGDYWLKHASHTPDNSQMAAPLAMRKDLRTCEHFALGFDDALCKLEQQEKLADRPMNHTFHENLERTLAELDRSLTRCDQDIRDGENSWASLRDHWKNQILFKLTLLSGLCVPIGVWAGVGGMNFANPIPDWALWGGLATSTIISAVLVGGLIAGKRELFRFLTKGT
jgi:Mg2+ and Co2+ transporter CorA